MVVLQVNLCQKLLFFASTNPQYDNRLVIELQVQYMKIPSWNMGIKNMLCLEIVSDIQNYFLHNMFSPCSEKRRTSDKDLPVPRLTLFLPAVDTHLWADSAQCQ